MAEEVDLWDVMREAEETVESWPLWQQRYPADVHYEERDESAPRPSCPAQ